MSEYLRPQSLDEALEARRAHPSFTVLAGGTDALVAANDKPMPAGIIDVFGLGELVGIREEGGALVFGAATTYREVLGSELVRERLPMLAAAAREVGALQIQARGTLGGNLATSSPVGDTLPVWLAADAEIELASAAGGRRRVAYDGYCTGYRQTQRRPDELIVAVRVPALPAGARQAWRKVGTRRAQSISKVMLAGVATVEGGRIEHLRLALGAVADRPVRARAAEAAVRGMAPGPEAAARAREALAGEIRPIDDLRSTAAYRLRVAQNLVARFVEALHAGA